jgi:hypothetical protein
MLHAPNRIEPPSRVFAPNLLIRADSPLSRAIAHWDTRYYDATLDALLERKGLGVGNARLGSSVGADTNDPIRLTFSGEKYLYLPGVDGNGALGPTIALADGIDYEIDLELANYTPAVTNTITNHRGSTLIWRAYLSPAGDLLFAPYNSSGSILATSVSVGALTGRQQFRFHANPATGEISIERKIDGTWSVIKQVTFSPWTMPSGTAPLSIGSNSASHVGEVITGKIYSTTLRDGIDGPVVAKFDASRFSEPYSTMTAETGEVWTINRSSTGLKAALVDRDMMLFGTGKYLEVPNHALLNFGAGQDFTVVVAGRHFTNSDGLNNALISKRSTNSGVAGTPGWMVFKASDGTNVGRMRIDDGITTIFRDQSITANGINSLIGGIRTPSQIELIMNGSSGGASSGTLNDLTNADALRIGRWSGAGTAYGAFELFSAAIFREALTTSQLERLRDEMRAR